MGTARCSSGRRAGAAVGALRRVSGHARATAAGSQPAIRSAGWSEQKVFFFVELLTPCKMALLYSVSSDVHNGVRAVSIVYAFSGIDFPGWILHDRLCT